jgi:hypothetical protein
MNPSLGTPSDGPMAPSPLNQMGGGDIFNPAAQLDPSQVIDKRNMPEPMPEPGQQPFSTPGDIRANDPEAMMGPTNPMAPNNDIIAMIVQALMAGQGAQGGR